MLALLIIACLVAVASLEAPSEATGAKVAMHEYTKRMGDNLESANRRVAAAVAQQCEALAAVPLAAGRAWTLLDMGTADGTASLPVIQQCVQRVHTASPGRPIATIFEDGPWNDFGPILRLDARATFGADVHPLVSSVNFFHVTVPRASVHVAFSCAAMHYLSGPPPALITDGGLHHTDASPAEQAAFAKQAAADWRTLLLARAAELAPGGRLVVSTFAIDSNGFYLGSTDYGKSIYTELSSCLREMVRDGLLTKEEFAKATSPE